MDFVSAQHLGLDFDTVIPGHGPVSDRQGVMKWRADFVTMRDRFGSLVRQGQLIGYSGTTGLSTGPHLHYETYRSGIAVNPRTVRFAIAAPAADDGQQAAFRARLKLLLGTARG